MTPVQLFLVITLVVITNCCSSPYHFDYSPFMGIKFYYTYTSESWGDFVFNNCTWQTCSRRFHGGCVEFSDVNNTDWDECTRKFCDPDVVYRQTYDSIGSCQQYQYQKYLVSFALELGLSLGLGVGIPLIIFIVRVCYMLKQNKREEGQTGNSQSGNNDQPVSRSSSAQSLSQDSHSHSHSSMVDLDDLPCAICLGDDPLLQLSCFHSFHRQCIAQQLQRKNQCPLCRQNQMQIAKSACQDCGGGASRVTLLRENALREPILCNGCRRK